MVALHADQSERVQHADVDAIVSRIFNFAYFADNATPIRQSCDMDDEIDGGCHIVSEYAQRHIDAAHGEHGFKAMKSIARAVGVEGGHGSLVTSVHRLHHVERFCPAALANDDAIGAHAQRIAEQVAGRHYSDAFHIGSACFKPHYMCTFKTQLGGIFNGDDALAWAK